MFQVSINSVQKHLNFVRQQIFVQNFLPNSRGDNTRNSVIFLALCSTLQIYLLFFQISIISIQSIWIIFRKQNYNQNFDLIQGEIISTIRAIELYFLCCAVPYIYIYKCIKYPSIPCKHIWVIVRKQNYNQNFYQIQGEIISTIRATKL